MKVNQHTAGHIATLTREDVPLYRAVGKTFLLSTKPEMESRFEAEHANHIQTIRDLMESRDILERRIDSAAQNIRDLISQ